jgi:hypothetical protein
MAINPFAARLRSLQPGPPYLPRTATDVQLSDVDAQLQRIWQRHQVEHPGEGWHAFVTSLERESADVRLIYWTLKELAGVWSSVGKKPAGTFP